MKRGEILERKKIEERGKRRSSPARMKAELVKPGWERLQVRSEQRRKVRKKRLRREGKGGAARQG